MMNEEKYKEWVNEHLISIIVGIAIVFIFVGLIGGAISENNTWNDGYCECGGKWEYVDTVTSIRGDKNETYTVTTFIYRCSRCGRMHEFSGVR